MKYIVLAIIFTFQWSYSQQKKIERTATSAKDVESVVVASVPQNNSIEKAHLENQLVYVSLGNMLGYLSKFELYFREYLFEEYGITSIDYGCVVTGQEVDFMNVMKAKIEEKYGENFIHTERTKAKVIYEKQNL